MLYEEDLRGPVATYSCNLMRANHNVCVDLDVAAGQLPHMYRVPTEALSRSIYLH